VMRRDFDVADASEMVDVVLQRLQGRDCHTIPVLRRGEFIGLVTMDNVGEFVSIQAAVGSRGKRTDPAAPRSAGLRRTS